MRVALAQFNAVVGDLTGNTENMRSIYAQAVESEVDLLVFPELSLCGYPPEDLLYKKHFLKDTRRAIEQFAADCPDITIVAGFAEDYKGKIYNAAAVLRGGGISEIYRKSMLPNYGVFDEQRYFHPGGEPVLIAVGNVNIALTICFDIWNIDWLHDFLENLGQIDMILNISASPFHLGKIKKREEIVSRCAREFDCVV